jgi:hypothetical protein
MQLNPTNILKKIIHLSVGYSQNVGIHETDSMVPQHRASK